MMQTLTLKVSESLLDELRPYRDSLDDLLVVGLRQVKLESALALFKRGDISLWKAARIAGVSLREMTRHAVAQGMRPTVDAETITGQLSITGEE